MRRGPPALARALLALVPRAHRDYVSGDLDEEFTEEVAPERGLLRAHLWYWGQVVRTVGAFLRRRPRSGPSKGPPPLPPLLREVRHAARGLRRRPGFTALAVVTLALGIGAVTSVFSLADAILLRPVPGVRGQDESAMLTFSYRIQGDRMLGAVPLPSLRALATAAPSVREIAGEQSLSLQVASEDLSPRDVEAEYVTGDYFSTLGVSAARGRLFTAAEAEVPGGPAIVVVSDAFWRGALLGDPDIVGRTLRVNGIPATVVGVTPPGFAGDSRLGDVRIWFPGAQYAAFTHRSDPPRPGTSAEPSFVRAVVRLVPGATREQAESELRAVAAHLVEEAPEGNGDLAEFPPTLERGRFGTSLGADEIVRSVYTLAALVLVILVVACANVAGLLVLQGLRRRGETTIRRALGAARGHLAALQLSEALLLAALAALLGLAVATAMDRGLAAAGLFPDGVAEEAAIDLRAFAFAAAAATLSALLFGALPTVLSGRVDVHATLKGAQRTASRAATFVQGGLTVVQLSLALALTAAAILLGRTVASLGDVDLGFDPTDVLAFRYDPGPQGYTSSEARRFHRAVLNATRHVPGIAAAAFDAAPPLEGVTFGVHVHHPLDPSRTLLAHQDFVSDDVFRVLGARVLAGRGFTPEEATSEGDGSTRAAVVNQSLARLFFGTPERALGKSLEADRSNGSVRFVVVGVIADLATWNLRRDPRPKLYAPPSAGRQTFGTLLVRTKRPLRDIEQELLRVVAAADPNVPLHRVEALSAAVEQATARERTFLQLAAVLAGLATLLAAVGLYAVVAYAAAERRREFGIRLALGANGRRLTRLVVGHALAFGVAGVCAGAGVAILGGRLLSRLLFGVHATDVPTLGAAAAFLLVVTLIASLTPALHATRVDPATTLRME